MGRGMTGKVGPGGGVKMLRITVSHVVLPRPVERRISFAVPVMGGVVS